jgi:V-type H+-transporting ATPase subunit H
VCLELLSDINAVYLVSKLQNRHWVDKDITDLLDKLCEYLDQNYKVFSSIDKWKKEVAKRSLKWGPVHSEKFWQENFIYFNDKENLDLIKVLIDLIRADDDRTKSIACYDLGEFARFFPMGRQMLEHMGVKERVIEAMG